MEFDYDRYYEPAEADRRWDADRSRRWTELNSAIELTSAIKANHVIELFRRAEQLSVLDVGCGDGQVLAQLAGRGLGPELVGLEVSETGARLARRHPEISRVQTFDGALLPFPDASFALVVASHVLEHVAEPLSLLHDGRGRSRSRRGSATSSASASPTREG